MATTKQIVKESTIQRIQNIIFANDETVLSRDSLSRNASFKSIVKNHMNKFERDRVDEILDMIYAGKKVDEITSTFNNPSDNPIKSQAEAIESFSSDESIFMLDGLRNVELAGGVEVNIGGVDDDTDDEEDEVIPETEEDVHTLDEYIEQVNDVHSESTTETIDETIEPVEAESEDNDVDDSVMVDENFIAMIVRTSAFPIHVKKNYGIMAETSSVSTR